MVPTPSSPNTRLVDTSASPHAELQGVGLADARITGGFWAARQQQACAVTLPHLWDRLADPGAGHVLTNLRIAAGLEDGEFGGVHWADAWMGKWLEAAVVAWEATSDADLEAQMDEAIALLAEVQAPDGYLASQTQANGEERFQDPHYHELYTMGHLVTAAVVHHRLTGKTSFLDIARRIGDCVHERYSGEVTRDMVYFPFNPSIIMGLVELYRETREARYLDAAQGFIDRRGTAGKRWKEQLLHDWMGTDLCQDRIPLRNESEMVGHSVLSTYLYAGAADAVAETGDRELWDALQRIWRNYTQHKMFINGGACACADGLSARGDFGKSRWVDVVHEAAGPEYFLPNALSYNETCAQIGVFMWAWRMLAIEPAGEYADVMEQTIYSGVLAGISLDGASWFYRNFLRWHRVEGGPYRYQHKRHTSTRFQPGPQAICCPTNLLRTVAEFHAYLYTVSESALWVHHYATSDLTARVPDGGPVSLTQETDYPWDGAVRITLTDAPGDEFSVKLRIPGWAEGATVSVNGANAGVEAKPGTYADIRRQWETGDMIDLNLPMQPRLMMAHPLVEELRNQVAVLRGPILYCLESHDLPDGVPAHEVHVQRDIELTAEHVPGLLGGVTVLKGTARRWPQGSWEGALYKPLPQAPLEPVPITLIPYYAWANRGQGEMTVWLPMA